MSDQRDQGIKAFSEPLERIEVPAELRQNNRAAIARALEKHASEPMKRVGWWKQRISIPLPLAAAILLVIGLQLLLQVRFTVGPQRGADPTGPDTPQISEIVKEEESFVLQCAQTVVTVPGLGPIYKVENYHF